MTGTDHKQVCEGIMAPSDCCEVPLGVHGVFLRFERDASPSSVSLSDRRFLFKSSHVSLVVHYALLQTQPVEELGSVVHDEEISLPECR